MAKSKKGEAPQGTELMSEEPRVEVDPEVMKMTGKVLRRRDAEVLDGQRWKTIMWTLPWIRRVILGCTAVTALSLMVTLGSYWTRAHPLLLLTYPDGTLRCAPQAFDNERHLTPRRSEDAVICALFESRVGGVGIGESE
jgi:hypothetical protein